jgi:hypothetical protein
VFSQLGTTQREADLEVPSTLHALPQGVVPSLSSDLTEPSSPTIIVRRADVAAVPTLGG